MPTETSHAKNRRRHDQTRTDARRLRQRHPIGTEAKKAKHRFARRSRSRSADGRAATWDDSSRPATFPLSRRIVICTRRIRHGLLRASVHLQPSRGKKFFAPTPPSCARKPLLPVTALWCLSNRSGLDKSSPYGSCRERRFCRPIPCGGAVLLAARKKTGRAVKVRPVV